METFTNIVLVCVALMFLGIYAAQQRGTIAAGPVRPPVEEEMISGWEDELNTGLRMGESVAPIRIVEFIDFECPYCRQLVNRLDTLLVENPGKIAVTMHHYPLSSHALAMPAAIGAECADRQGAFQEYYNAVMLSPEPLGVLSIETYGSRIGIEDLSRFRECLSFPPDSFPRIGYGQELGRRTGVRGTPTVWFEGLRLVGTPTLRQLRELTAAALDSDSDSWTRDRKQP